MIFSLDLIQIFWCEYIIWIITAFLSLLENLFRFRFFRFGEWVEVCVDDRLPTRGGQLIYLKAKDKNEFWSPLLEKVLL